jgi:hypothetical protein
MAWPGSWINRHFVLTGFLIGAVASTIAAMIFLEVYGIWMVPAWGEIVFYPGLIVGSWTYSYVVESTGGAVIAGHLAVAIFYGAIGALIGKLVRPRRGGTSE